MRIIYPLILSNLFCMATLMSFMVVMGPMIRTLGMQEWQGGVIFAVAGISWMLCSRIWGRLSDRYGRKRILLLVLFGFAISFILFSLYLDYALSHQRTVLFYLVGFILIRLLMGMFYSGVPVNSHAFIADNIMPIKRASTMALMSASSALGLIAGPVLVGWLIDELGSFSTPFLAISVLPILSLCCVYFMLPSQSVSISKQTTPFRMNDVRIRLPLCAAFIAMLSVLSVQVLTGFLAIDRLNVEIEQAPKIGSYALTVVGLTMMSVALLMNLVRLKPIIWIIIGSLISMVGFVALMFIEQFIPFLVSYFIIGLGTSMLFPSMNALAANAVTANEQGLAAGSIAAMQGFASVIAPLIATLLYRWNTNSPYLLCVIGLLGLMLFALRCLFSIDQSLSHRTQVNSSDIAS